MQEARLAKMLDRQLIKLKLEVEKVDREIGTSLHMLVDRDNDGKFSREEVRSFASTRLSLV